VVCDHGFCARAGLTGAGHDEVAFYLKAVCLENLLKCLSMKMTVCNWVIG
jgi:hypothetical protein